MRTLKMETKKYEGTGRCAYCMLDFPDDALTNEHIVPEAIHGALLWNGGACSDCANQMNKLWDNPVLNGDLLLARLLLDLRGKNKNKPAQELRHLPPVYAGDTTTGGPGARLLDFPVELYPKVFHLPVFQQAGFLAGVERTGTLEVRRLCFFHVGGQGLTGVTVSQEITSGKLAMAIAKMAYCFAAAERGLNSFDGEPIRQLLRQERDDIYNFVGSPQDLPNLTKRFLHKLYLREIDGWLVVLVHLFASIPRDKHGAMPYEVVVGRLAA